MTKILRFRKNQLKDQSIGRLTYLTKQTLDALKTDDVNEAAVLTENKVCELIDLLSVGERG